VVQAGKSALDEDEREAFDELVAVCGEGGDLSELDIGVFAGKSGSPRHVVLMNLHTAKGTEFNNVILVGMDQGRMPIHRAQSPDEIAEQRRLFFVGVSRARHALHILYSGFTENRWGRRFNHGPSPFVTELQARLKRAGQVSPTS
jgi:DNA helicase-2/ATP-dependent DNA helicase PcrA